MAQFSEDELRSQPAANQQLQLLQAQLADSQRKYRQLQINHEQTVEVLRCQELFLRSIYSNVREAILL
ncbi:MAG: hypothetical protein HC886_04940 [Leptolyngbyaceae cyanobacterium SM1_1_3]|nr:hypothetical protein [Leptolyngbyaceae cyanobacterium SM1_1_3]